MKKSIKSFVRRNAMTGEIDIEASKNAFELGLLEYEQLLEQLEEDYVDVVESVFIDLRRQKIKVVNTEVICVFAMRKLDVLPANWNKVHSRLVAYIRDSIAKGTILRAASGLKVPKAKRAKQKR